MATSSSRGSRASATTAVDVQRLTLSSPDAFLASIPHLLGFPPTDSVVLVGLKADGPNAAPTVRLTQRFDTPTTPVRGAVARDLARGAAAPMVASGSTEVIIAVFGGTTPASGSELPSAALVDDLITALDDADLGVRDALYTDGTSRWSYGCADPACCPPAGRVIPGEVRTLVAAEFAVAGAAMTTSREALVAEIAPTGAASIAAVADRVADLEAPGDGVEVEGWRDASIAAFDDLRTGSLPSTEATARVLTGLGDIRVRDTVLWDLSRPGVDTDAAIAGLTSVVRRAPRGHVAPAATVLAIQHWAGGDGARANACLDRATADNPEYSLALMVGTALRSGLPPQAWAASLAGLTRNECRHGVAAAPPRRATPTPAPTPTPSITPSASPGLAG